MVRTILKVIGLALAAIVVVVGVLYQFFGLRFVMDGAGTPRPSFVQTNELQAERIERVHDASDAAMPLPVAQAQLAVDDRQRVRVARDAGEKARAEIKHVAYCCAIADEARYGHDAIPDDRAIP